MILKTFLLSFILFLSMSPPVETDDHTFTVTIKVSEHIPAGRITLIIRELGQWVEYATESRNGVYVISNKISEPSFAFAVLKYSDALNSSPKVSNILDLFIEPRNITIEATDSLATAVVTSGNLQKDLQEYSRELKALKAQHVLIDKGKKYEFAKVFITAHAGSMVSLYAIQNFMLNQSFVTDPTYSEELFQLLSPAVQNTQSAKLFHNDIRIAKTTALGSTAPDFAQSDTTGNSFRLSSLKGKYVFIDFWASWCKPCREENPALVKTYYQFKDKNFTIVGVSLDNNKDSWLKAIHKDQLAWHHVSDLKFWKNEVALLYGISTVPQNYLLDPNGKIIDKNIKGEDLHKKLEKLLGAE